MSNDSHKLCGICNLVIQSESIECDLCKTWIHRNCSDLTKKTI